MSPIQFIDKIIGYIENLGQFLIRLAVFSFLIISSPMLIGLGIIIVLLGFIIPPLKGSTSSFFTDYYNMIVNRGKKLFKSS